MQLTEVHEAHWEPARYLFTLYILDYVAEVTVHGSSVVWTVSASCDVIGSGFSDNEDAARAAAERFITDHHAQTAQG
jgi:hypothetical protein